jgi:TonB family protein
VRRSVGAEALAIAGDLAPAEFPLPAPANPSAPTGLFVGDTALGVTPPRLLEQAPPRYSEEARKAHLAGAVRIACTVGADGVARSFRVLNSLGLGLDESAMQAIRFWRFAPGVKDGKPVNVRSTIEVHFQLTEQDSKSSHWRLARVDFGPAPGVTRAAVATIVPPQVLSNATGATATVSFTIDDKGNVTDSKVEKSSEHGWAQDVAAAILKWRFTPARRDGVPVSVTCAMEFVRGN